MREAHQLGEVGIVTAEVDGKWYVSPVRTYNELQLTFLQAVEKGDLESLLDSLTGRATLSRR